MARPSFRPGSGAGVPAMISVAIPIAAWIIVGTPLLCPRPPFIPRARVGMLGWTPALPWSGRVPGELAAGAPLQPRLLRASSSALAAAALVAAHDGAFAIGTERGLQAALTPASHADGRVTSPAAAAVQLLRALHAPSAVGASGTGFPIGSGSASPGLEPGARGPRTGLAPGAGTQVTGLAPGLGALDTGLVPGPGKEIGDPVRKGEDVKKRSNRRPTSEISPGPHRAGSK